MASKQAFLAARTTGLEKTSVDSIFYCTGTTVKFTHMTEKLDLFDWDKDANPDFENPKGRDFGWVTRMHSKELDPLKLIANFAQDHGKSCFWSLRMNDTHDSTFAELRPWAEPRWKLENPHLLMHPERQQSKYGWINGPSWTWSALDYNHEEVRDRILETVADVAMRYRLEGLELDFTRFPVFFS